MEVLVMAGQLILGLSILVGLHELGHLLAARMFGMRVEQYFIGFPPKVFSIRRGETEYGLGAIPLGGYVKISGMIDESLDTAQMQTEPQPWEFRAKPAWQRLIVMLGGIIVNIITGIVIFVALTYKNGDTFLAAKDVKYGIVAHDLAQQIGLKTGDRIVAINGKPYQNFNDVITKVILENNSTYTVDRLQPNGTTQRLTIDVPNNLVDKLSDKKSAPRFIEPVMPFEVGEVVAGTPAEKAGLKAGDRIVAVNNQPTKFFHEVQQLIRANKGKTIPLNVVRGGAPVALTVSVLPEGTIGFQQKPLLALTTVRYSFGQSLVRGTERAFTVIFDNIKGFGKIFRGDVAPTKALSGPGKIARDLFGGVWIWEKFWYVVGVLSMALAFMNALPIPALDGGHSTILLYEMVSGRKPSDRFLEAAQKVGMVILLGLMAFVLFNDAFDIIFR